MKNKIKLNRLTHLLTAITIFVICGASNLAFAQESKYPKPDLSALEEYYEIVKYEYDFEANIPALNMLIKRKTEKSPKWWKMRWIDADGVAVRSDSPSSGFAFLPAVGDPFRVSFYAPWKKDMPKVKKIFIYENPN